MLSLLPIVSLRHELDEAKHLFPSTLRTAWYTFHSAESKISSHFTGRERTKARQEEVEIKCVISFRHQSASNRRDLELNSLLPTRHTTLFTGRSYVHVVYSRAGWRQKDFYATLRVYNCIKYLIFGRESMYMYTVLEIHRAASSAPTTTHISMSGSQESLFLV